MVEKLFVSPRLAAFIAVIISINAKIPSAIIIIVITVRSLLPFTFFHESASESLLVIFLFVQ